MLAWIQIHQFTGLKGQFVFTHTKGSWEAITRGFERTIAAR
jgi:hypothetical protein